MSVILALWLGWFSISVIPERGVIPLTGQARSIEILGRNTLPYPLLDVRLLVQAESCDGSATPATIPRVEPGDRFSFSVTVMRRPETQARRFPATISITSANRGELRRFDLLVDATPGASLETGDFIDVGTVKVKTASPARRTLLLAVIGLLPVGALLLLGAHLKRRARRQ
ncbi:MAG: hypothetical protein GYA21_13870 [Myxococcales bacterium]|nr:hypothetical protein [Myxococcales bacterium]